MYQIIFQKISKNFSEKLVRIGISVQIDSEGRYVDFDTSKNLETIFQKWLSKRKNSNKLIPPLNIDMRITTALPSVI